MRALLVVGSLGLWGCKGGPFVDEPEPGDDTDVAPSDRDQDGTPDAEDCLPDDPTSHPGAPETWYDGLDQDCDGANDYDRDGDGYVDDAYVALAGLPGGDCDDADPDANPGLREHWYDGHDRDCAGDDDWDQDLDGWQYGTASDDAAREAYAAHYGYDLPDAQWGDCDDGDAEVNPGVADDWYDGLDADCDGADDYDRDGDGFRGGLLGDDCDDLDATVHPGAEDALGDDVDADCSGSDLAAIDADASTYDAPRGVIALADEGRYLLVSAADEVSWDTRYAWPGFLFWWETPGGAPDERLVWQNPVASSAGEIGSGIAAATTGGGFVASIGYSRSVGGVPYSYHVARGATWDASRRVYELESLKVSALRDSSDVASDADVYPTSAGSWTLGCSPGHLWWLFVTPSGLQEYGSTDLYGGDTCVLEPTTSSTTLTATVCDGAACTRYDVGTSGTIEVSATQPWTAAYTLANRRGDWLVLVEPDGGLTLAEDGGVTYTDVLAEHTDIRDADAAWHDGTVFIALAVGDRSGDGVGDALLAWGTPDSLEQVVVPFVEGTVVRDVAHASVYADGDLVFLALSGDDGIGWSFTPR